MQVLIAAAVTASLVASAFGSGVLVYPPPRQLPASTSPTTPTTRPWLKKMVHEEFNRMSIEDLPESLPEYEMYCRGVPSDGAVQTVSSGQPVDIEWDILQADQGECRVMIVCPLRLFKQELWRGPCGLAAGKARSKAVIPSGFKCGRGECYITWFYETVSRRRFCNCFDIEVSAVTSIVQGPPVTVTNMATNNVTITDSIILTMITTATETIVTSDTLIVLSTAFSVSTVTVTPSVSTMTPTSDSMSMPMPSTDLTSTLFVATEIISVMTSVIVDTVLVTLTSTSESTLISTITLHSTLTVDAAMLSTLPLTETVSDFKLLSGSCAPTSTVTLLLLRVSTVTSVCPIITVTSCLSSLPLDTLSSSDDLIPSTTMMPSPTTAATLPVTTSTMAPTMQLREKPIQPVTTN